MSVTEIYFIRHCEATGNISRRIQGVTDNDITEMGAKQLVHLSKRFKDIELDAVYSSPLKRTIKTAHAVADPKGLEVKTADDVIEINCGIYEDIPFEELFSNPQISDIWRNHPQDLEPEGGEPQRDAYVRIWEASKRLARENRGKSIAVATHGGVIRCLCCRLKLGTVERLVEMPYADNTAVTLVRFDDDLNAELVFFNDNTHLPEDCMPKYSRVPSPTEAKV